MGVIGASPRTPVLERVGTGARATMGSETDSGCDFELLSDGDDGTGNELRFRRECAVVGVAGGDWWSGYGDDEERRTRMIHIDDIGRGRTFKYILNERRVLFAWATYLPSERDG